MDDTTQKRSIVGLSSYECDPACSDFDRLVVRYAGELTTRVKVNEALHSELSSREVVGLAVVVATANLANRVKDAFGTQLDHYYDLQGGGHGDRHSP